VAALATPVPRFKAIADQPPPSDVDHSPRAPAPTALVRSHCLASVPTGSVRSRCSPPWSGRRRHLAAAPPCLHVEPAAAHPLSSSSAGRRNAIGRHRAVLPERRITGRLTAVPLLLRPVSSLRRRYFYSCAVSTTVPGAGGSPRRGIATGAPLLLSAAASPAVVQPRACQR
jgi:hypothetical protein